MIPAIFDFEGLNKRANELEMERVQQIVNAPPAEEKTHYEFPQNYGYSYGNTDADYTCWESIFSWDGDQYLAGTIFDG